MRSLALAIVKIQLKLLELPHPANKDCGGIRTLADATDANKKSAQVYLSGNSPLASAYAHTPPPQLLQSPLHFVV